MKSPSPVPERIAVVGHFGTGKSQCWVTWAAAQRMSGEGETYVINADRAGMVELSNAKYPDWQDNVHHIHVRDWRGLRDAANNFTGQTKPGDLIVVDGIERAWEWVRVLFTETENRRKGITFDDSDPFFTLPEVKMDWDAIKGAYYRWLDMFLSETQTAHTMLVGASQPLKVKTDASSWGDDQEVIDLYLPWGVRPAGEKTLGKHVHTVLLATHRKKDYVLTTMKETDSTREYMTDEVIPPDLGFPLTYLVARAGWSL